jgi:hypothetical protein
MPWLKYECYRLESFRSTYSVLGIRFLIGLTFCLRASWAQPLQVPAIEPEGKEPYEIYSTVLQAMHPNVREWVILNKTRGYDFASFIGSSPFGLTVEFGSVAQPVVGEFRKRLNS